MEYRGQIERKSGGRYDNRHVGIWRVEAGRIIRYVEYFDPVVLSQSFGDSVGSTFSLRAPDT